MEAKCQHLCGQKTQKKNLSVQLNLWSICLHLSSMLNKVMPIFVHWICN
jgi:hypothetical protein